MTYPRDIWRIYAETEPLRGSVSILQVANSGYTIQTKIWQVISAKHFHFPAFRKIKKITVTS